MSRLNRSNYVRALIEQKLQLRQFKELVQVVSSNQVGLHQTTDAHTGIDSYRVSRLVSECMDVYKVRGTTCVCRGYGILHQRNAMCTKVQQHLDAESLYVAQVYGW